MKMAQTFSLVSRGTDFVKIWLTLVCVRVELGSTHLLFERYPASNNFHYSFVKMFTIVCNFKQNLDVKPLPTQF